MANLDQNARIGPRSRLALAGLLAIVLTGCVSTPAVKIFDLGQGGTAPQPVQGVAVMAVSEPFVLQILDTDRMLVRNPDGSISALAGVQWTDRTPALVQARLIRAFEAKGRSAIRKGSGMAADYEVRSELTAFQVIAGDAPEIDIQIGVKLVQAADGKIIGSRLFRGRQTIGAIDGGTVSAGFDAVLAGLADDVVRWSTAIQ